MDFRIKHILLFVVGLIYCLTLIGQSKHELSIEGGAGLSGLQYKTTIGKKNNSIGGHLGGGYTYYAFPFLGIHTGVEFSLYNSKTTIDDLYNKYITTDPEGVDFEFRSRISNYKENQIAVYANIPIMFQYHHQFGDYKFYAGVGGKLGIPVLGRYRTEGITIKNSGDYDEFEPEYETQEFLGFGTFTGKKVSKSMDFKVAYIAAAEVGMKWELPNRQSIYTGIYFDYALNNVQKDVANKEFVEYNSASPRDFTTNSIMYSQYQQNGTSNHFTKKINPIAVGVKLRYAFGSKPKPKKQEPIEVPIITVAPPVDSTNLELAVDDIEDDKSKDLLAKQTPVIDSTKYIVKKDTTILSIDNKIEVILNRNFGNLGIDRFGDKDKGGNIDLTQLEKQEPELVAKTEPSINIKRTTQEEDEYNRSKLIITEDISGYAINATKLTPSMKAQVDKKIAELKKHPNLRVTLEGNTCDIGGSAINRRLGLERAEGVRTYLIEQGIDQRRISVVSYGKWDPEKQDQQTEESRRRNRRVEIIAVE